MTEQDDAEFFDAFSQRADSATVAGHSFPSPTPAVGLPLPAFGVRQEIHLVSLSITPTPTCSRQSNEGSWHFDLFRDVHIEFQRSYIHKDTLVSGRIFAKIGWCADAHTNQAFRRWFSSIQRWLKQRYRRIDSDFWIGPHAEQWSLCGGLLAFGNPNAMIRSLAHDNTGNASCVTKRKRASPLK